MNEVPSGGGSQSPRDSDTENDDTLWVYLRSHPGVRHFIAGSAHTFPGRFAVVPSTELHTLLYASKGDVERMSEQSRVWISGFLCGQESTFGTFLGGAEPDPAERDVSAWKKYNETLHDTGTNYLIAALPTDVFEFEHVSAPVPWTFVAGRYWTLKNGSWVGGDFRDDYDEFWPDSICEKRGHHALAQLGESSLCEDCHQVSE